MKNIKKYILGVMALVGAAVLPACQDHFDEPGKGDKIPQATMEPNTTIAQIKEWMWEDAYNYCDQVYTLEWYNTPAAERTEAMKTEGTHIVVAGRVVSSDYAGNCFKYIVLQDGTGALNFSINSYNLYLNYRVGQEIVVDLTGLNMGKYRGLEQVGFPSFNSSIPGYETSFMAPESFARHAELNGLPNVAAVDTIVVDRFADLGVTPAELRKWQSQLVRFNNVEFTPNATLPTLSTYHSSGETQVITDAEGNTLDIRTSGYANFWNMPLPVGKCDVVALLGYYVNLGGSGGWQLTLIDANSIMNVGDPTVPKGSETNPYNVMEAIAYEVNSAGHSGWVSGYIVGTVAPEVETVTSNADIEWNNEPTLGNTLVIGNTPETKDINECLVVALPQGSDLRTYGALRENPANYMKEITIKGTFAEVMGTYGITNNNGSSSEFHIEGLNIGPEPPVLGDGTEANPYNCAQVIALNPQSTTDAVESGVWVSGYVVGYYQDYAPHFEAGGTQRANILISDNPSASAAGQCVCIQLVAQTDARNALNLVDNPGVLGAKVSLKGDVMKYNTLPGIKNTSSYTIDGGGSVTPPNPPVTNDGSEANPFTCAEVISLNPQSTTEAVKSGVWVSGYVVGYYQDYAPHFEAGGSQRANILISDNASANAADQCVCIQLVANTDPRNALNLVDNPGVLGKKVSVMGDVMKYNTLPGIKNTSNYKIDGTGPVTPPVTGTPEGDGTAASPYNVTAALNVAKSLADGQNVAAYAKGTVASITEISTSFGNATYIITDGSSSLQVYRGYYLNGDKFTSEDQLKVGDEVVVSGELVNYKGNTPQFTTGSQLISINNGGQVTPPTPPTPPTPSDDYKGNFNSFNGGTPKSSYGEYTNATGWKAVNCSILSGLAEGAAEQNPRFAFIGNESTLAVCLNGKKGGEGVLTSPVLTGGCKTITFNYGFPFSDTKCTFTIEVIQNGTAVVTKTVELSGFTTKTAYNYSLDANVSGDFQIRIVNDAVSQKSANSDRIAIWNFTWTN